MELQLEDFGLLREDKGRSISKFIKVPICCIRHPPTYGPVHYIYSLIIKSPTVWELHFIRQLEKKDPNNYRDYPLVQQFRPNSSLVGVLVDEVLLKMHIGTASRNSHGHINKLWLHQLDLEVRTDADYWSAKKRKQNKFNIDFGCSNISKCCLFLWPTDGSVLVQTLCGCEPKLGWLSKPNNKPKQERLLSVKYATTDFCISRNEDITQTSFVFHSKLKVLTVLFTVTSRGGPLNKKRIAFGSFKRTDSKEFDLQTTVTSLYSQLEDGTPQGILTAFQNHLVVLPDYMKVVGHIFKCWVIVIASTDERPETIVCRAHKAGSVRFEMSSEPLDLTDLAESAVELCGTKLMVTRCTKTNFILSGPDLAKDEKLAMVKMYRTCANCGKGEQRKRRNAKGQRIAKFKVCRICKKKGNHRKWDDYPCHYCGPQCQKKHWKDHKKLCHSAKALTRASTSALQLQLKVSLNACKEMKLLLAPMRVIVLKETQVAKDTIKTNFEKILDMLAKHHGSLVSQ